MYSVVYVSSAVNLFAAQELENLLAKCQEKNRSVGVTGMLLYKDGNFMQFLEGPHEAVMALLEKIKADPRHRGMIVLLQEEQAERQFPNWSMGFKKLDTKEAANGPDISDFLNLPLSSEQFLLNPSRSLQLLLSFRKIVR